MNSLSPKGLCRYVKRFDSGGLDSPRPPFCTERTLGLDKQLGETHGTPPVGLRFVVPAPRWRGVGDGHGRRDVDTGT